MFRIRTRFVLSTCATKYVVNFGGVLQVDRFAPSGVRRAAETSAISISPTWAERRLHRGVRNSTGSSSSSSSSSSSTCKVVFCSTMGTTGGGDSKQPEACDTSGGAPPPAAPARAGMPPRRLSAEVSAAVDEFNWPPILSREWTSSASPSAGGVVGAPNVGALEEGGAGVGLAADAAGGGGGGGKRLKVLTWNVLCDGLSGSHPEKGGFLMAPEGSLDWDKRRWKLLEEILRWDCDVLVLQEVDHHHDWLSPMLAKEGYRSLFVKKPIAPGLTFSPSLEDGCSLFYRVSVPVGDGGAGASGRRGGGGDPEQGKSASEKTTLDLLDAHTFTYAIDETEEGGEEEKGMQGEGVEGGGSKKSKSNSDTAAAAAAAAADKKVSQNQVAMISLLSVSAGCGGGNGSGNGGGRDGDGESLVVVATTHLKASKDKRGEVMRSRQAQQLLDEVTRFREGHERGRGLPSGSIPLVIAGDFNAAPHRSKAGSDGYEPLCFRQVTAHPLALRSAFPLKGAFTTWKIRPGPRRVAPVAEAGGGVEASAEAGATTGAGGQGGGKGIVGTKETKHCIDYVWVSGGVRPSRHSMMPTEEALGPLRAPSFVYPSDHFAVAVDLVLPYC